MSLHNFNSSNKSWAMYTHTLSSISGDDLTLKPYNGKNLVLEVSGNNSAFFKKGGISHDLTNLSGGVISIVSGLDASFSNLDINGNLNPLVANGSSIGLDNKNWNSAYINNVYCETINRQYIPQHYTQRFGNSLWNQFGQDISFSNPIVLFGISNNGRVVAFTEPAYSSNRGRLYVYEISFNGISYSWQTLGLSSEILVGQTTTGNFGGDGNSVISLSSDGRVVAVNDTLNDTSGTDTGQVRVFELSANIWRQRGQLINGKPIASYGLGYNIALSGNGNILAASSLTRPSPRKGEIFVYELSGNSWIKIGQDISGVGGVNFNDLGFSMSLSLDGTTLAAGYRGATSPQVEIYRFNSTSRLWDIIGPVPGSTIDQYFGWNIKLSGDGNTIVIGGIGYGTSTGNTSNGIGSVSVFKYNSGTSWSQLGQIIYGASGNDKFGQWVQISNDGTIMSAGGTNSYVRVYKLYSNTWIQIGQVLNGSGIAPNLGFPGHALSGDGTTLVQTISKSGNSSMARVYGMNRTIDNILSINSNTLMISGELFTSGNLNPLNNNMSSLGIATKIWGNAYLKDLSVGSIEVSGNIIPLRFPDISYTLGSSLKRWKTLFANDLNINRINGVIYNSFSVLTSVSSDTIPINNNILKLGDVSRNWANAYIRDLSVSSIDVSLNLNPLNANGSSLGVISRNWGNCYIRDMSVSSIDVSLNLNPLISNGSSLGLITKIWRNAYIRDMSVSSIDVSLNLNPLLVNGSSLGLISKNWGNAYIRDLSVGAIDVSQNLNPLLVNGSSLGVITKMWGNAYIRDMSVSSIDVSLNINPLLNNGSSLGLSTRMWGNAYIRDISVSSIDVSLNLTPLLNNTLSLGLPTRTWSNAYIRDISVTSLGVSGNIIPLITNNSNLGSSLNRWSNVFVGDLSVNTINGQVYSGGTSINLSSISGNIIPSVTNIYNLGDVSRNWNNAYIRNLIVSNRAYQEISGDISWSAVNGHYGLAKDAYPALNPRSSGVKAVQTWTRRTTEASHKWHSVCWSPELGIFVAVAYFGTNRVMTSPNGINWTPRLASELQSTQWISVCWSPQLRLFVAVGAYNGTNRVMRSIDGTTWISSTLGVESQHNWHSVCWSAELGRFLAVANGTNRVMSSKDGITWSTITAISSSAWLGVCWSKELGIFVAVSNNGIVMRSSDGINWTLGEAVPVNNWFGVCWSPELGIFVAVASGGSATRVMYSYNGTNWSNNSITGVNSNVWYSVCWSPVLNLFLAVSENGTAMTSNNGINWTSITILSGNWLSTCWSPELGIFAIVSQDGTSMALTSSLKGRPPTSYNVFDSSFNSIDETGKWTFQNIAITTTLTVNTTVYNSDDRLKHNEVGITNGLAVIDQLKPKFYQKTQTLLDASYNGDLSGQTWTYEAGLIAQEVLQVPDLSFVVGGGDYYERVMVSDVSDVRYALSYYEQKMNSDLSFANSYKEQKISNDLSFTISYYQEKMNSDLSFGFDGSYNIQQILNDLSFDISYHQQKMNNQLNFYLSYNEQKINYDLSFELSYYQQQQSSNDLSQSNYYEVSKNLVKQVYAINYNSVFIYGLAAIKELHAKIKAQDISLLEQQATINSLAARLQALEPNASQ